MYNKAYLVTRTVQGRVVRKPVNVNPGSLSHGEKKTREFHDDERENISGESELLCFSWLYGIPRISAASGLRRLLTFLTQMRRLFEGGAYSSKYGRFPEPGSFLLLCVVFLFLFC